MYSETNNSVGAAITAAFAFVAAPSASAPWSDAAPRLSGGMVDLQTGRTVEVNLLPMGATVLRKVTFPGK